MILYNLTCESDTKSNPFLHIPLQLASRVIYTLQQQIDVDNDS